MHDLIAPCPSAGVTLLEAPGGHLVRIVVGFPMKSGVTSFENRRIRDPLLYAPLLLDPSVQSSRPESDMETEQRACRMANATLCGLRELFNGVLSDDLIRLALHGRKGKEEHVHSKSRNWPASLLTHRVLSHSR